MTITLDGTSGVTTPGVVNTAAETIATTLAVTGAVTLSSTLAVTGSITPSQTNGIVGTTTNNSVNAGGVGEYVNSEVASAGSVSMTSSTTINITSISLTAGDWDVFAIGKGNTAGSAVISWVRCSVSETSATYNDGHSFANESTQNSINIGAPAFGIPPKRYLLSTTTTLYLTLQAGYTPGTVGGYGRLSARRIR